MDVKRGSQCKKCLKFARDMWLQTDSGKVSVKKSRENDYKINKDKKLKYQAKYRSEHPEIVKKYRDDLAEARPFRYTLNNARTRARKRGTPFNITEQDIKNIWPLDGLCPVLGIKLNKGLGKPSDSSPSLDVLIPSLGYVLGNVTIISYRANTLKSNCTDPTELEKIATWMRSKGLGL
ncbi:MAG: hypothetical protein WBE18_05790 [Gammaproteobacteria bacterium]